MFLGFETGFVAAKDDCRAASGVVPIVYQAFSERTSWNNRFESLAFFDPWQVAMLSSRC